MTQKPSRERAQSIQRLAPATRYGPASLRRRPAHAERFHLRISLLRAALASLPAMNRTLYSFLLHLALPLILLRLYLRSRQAPAYRQRLRSEEHTSELQSPDHLV